MPASRIDEATSTKLVLDGDWMGRNQPPEGSLQFSGVRALADVQGQPDAFAVLWASTSPRRVRAPTGSSE